MTRVNSQGECNLSVLKPIGNLAVLQQTVCCDKSERKDFEVHAYDGRDDYSLVSYSSCPCHKGINIAAAGYWPLSHVFFLNPK